MKKLPKTKLLEAMLAYYGDEENIISQAQESLFDGVDDGWCEYCGEEHDYNVEPDAENYLCHHCNLRGVKAVNQLLLEGLL